MASKAKSPQIQAASLNDILNPLCNAIRQKFGRPDLAMNEVDRTSTIRSLYALTGAGSVSAQTDRKCILNQLLPRTNPELWLGILLELKKRPAQETYEIFHVSIQAFEGATSQSVEPLLRAEWDPKISVSHNGPAQPHWHAYGRPAAVEPTTFMSGEDPEDFGDVAGPHENIKQRQHKFHFALCANWHKKGSHFENLSGPDELTNWILGAIGYIQSEL